MSDDRTAAPLASPASPAPLASPASPASRRWSGRALAIAVRVGGLAIAILIVIVVFTLLSKPNTFLTVTNALTVVRTMSTIAIVALGLTLVIVVGEIDLSFGYMYGLASILVGVSWILWGWPIYAAIALGFVAAVLVGLSNAFLVSLLKIPSFIVTLGTGQLIFGTTLLVSNTATLNPAYPPAGRSVPPGELAWFLGLSNQDLPLGIPMQGLWMLGVAVVIGLILSRSLFGFRLKAIGGNPEAAELARLPVRKYKFTAFVLSAVLASLAAVLDFAFIGSVQPNAGVSLLFPVFAAVIIGGASLAGGRGTAIGTLSGALLLAIISNGLALLSAGSYLSQFVSGAVTIAAVALDRLTQRLWR